MNELIKKLKSINNQIYLAGHKNSAGFTTTYKTRKIINIINKNIWKN